jgi:cytochrome b561
MIGMPPIGWAMLSAPAYPVVVFSSFHLPAILPQNDNLHARPWDAHALVRRDGVLEAMASVSVSTRDEAMPSE